MFTRIGRSAGAFTVSTCLILSMPAAAMAAEGDAPVPLTLDTAFTGATGKTVEDEPVSLRDCTAFPHGSTANTDGWKFNLPTGGGTVQAYTIALIETVGGVPQPMLLGITATGIVRIAFTPATMQGQITPDDLLPAPEGVSGGLIDKGAWLDTPAGWRLAFGALLVDGVTGGGTFALTEVCLPAPSPSTSSPVSASASPSTRTSASPSTQTSAAAPSSSAPEAGGGLPITGSPTGPLALAGLAAVAAGFLLLAIRRRRDKVRFQA